MELNFWEVAFWLKNYLRSSWNCLINNFIWRQIVHILFHLNVIKCDAQLSFSCLYRLIHNFTYSEWSRTSGLLEIEIELLLAQISKLPLLTWERTRVEHFRTVKHCLIRYELIILPQILDYVKISQLHINMIADKNSSWKYLHKIVFNNSFICRCTSLSIAEDISLLGATLDFFMWLYQSVKHSLSTFVLDYNSLWVLPITSLKCLYLKS